MVQDRNGYDAVLGRRRGPRPCWGQNLFENPTLSGIEESRARVPQWPEAVLEWFRWPNVVAIEGKP